MNSIRIQEWLKLLTPFVKLIHSLVNIFCR